MPECGKVAAKARRVCSRCRERMRRDVPKRLFELLRFHAAQRGKVFTLELEYFRELVVRTGYDLRHGRGPDDLQIDRIDPRRGYEPGNVQVITARDNRRKAWAERRGWVPKDGETMPF